MTTIADLVRKYIDLRDRVKAMDEEHDQKTKPLRDAMQVIEGACAIHLKTDGSESIRTEHGTVYQSTTMSAKVMDREALFDFVRDADAFQLLTAAVSKDAVKEYMDEHQGMAPPGIEIGYFTKTNFRRA